MRLKSLFLVSFLAIALAACGDDDGGDGDGTGQPDGSISLPPDSGTDTPDAAMQADAAPTVNAASLGQKCNPEACPTGYTCLVEAQDRPGFCSLPCMGQMDMTTCSSGFPGPGQGACVFQATIMGMNQPFCGVLCGAQWMLPNNCPTGLTCKDITGPGGNPDGMNDVCLP